MNKRVFTFIIFLIGFAALFAVYWWPFLSGTHLGPIDWDWQWFYRYLSFIKESWVHNRLPIFSYLMTPFLANGETSALYPLNFLMKYLSVIDFIKVNVAIHYLAGFAGLWLIFDKLKINKKFLLISALIALFNGNVFAHFYIGHYGWLVYLLLPLLYAFYLKMNDHWLFPVAIGVLLATGLYEGGQHIVIWFGMFLAVVMIFDFVSERRGLASFLKNVALIAIPAALFSLAKLLPSQFLYSGIYDSNSAILGGFESWKDIYLCLAKGCFKKIGGEHYKWPLMWWEQYSYIGQLAIVSFIGYVFWPLKKRGNHEKSLLLAGLMFLLFSYNEVWFYLAKIIPVSTIISQRHPSRLIIIFIFVLSILIPLWLDRLTQKINSLTFRMLVIVALTIFMTVDYTLVNHTDFKFNEGNYLAKDLDAQYQGWAQPIYQLSNPDKVYTDYKINRLDNSLFMVVDSAIDYSLTFNSLLVKHHRVNIVAQSSDGKTYRQTDVNNKPVFDLPAGNYSLTFRDEVYNRRWPLYISIGSILAFILACIISIFWHRKKNEKLH